MRCCWPNHSAPCPSATSSWTLIACKNGTLDLRTQTLRAHEPADLITRIAPVRYLPDADAGPWERFLEQVLPDPDTRRYVQQIAGLCLTGDASERKLWMFVGEGKNGKSVLAKMLARVLGDYATYAAPGLLLEQRFDSHPTDVADLHKIRLAICSEVPTLSSLDVAKVKRVTGNEPVKARRMREDFWTYHFTSKLLMLVNSLPIVTDPTPSTWDRLFIGPFRLRLRDDQVDTHIDTALAEVLDGIFAWMVRGLADYLEHGLVPSDEVLDATARYRARYDLVEAFINEHCVFERGAYLTSEELREAVAQPEIFVEYKKVRQRLIELGARPKKNPRRLCGVRLIGIDG